MNNQKAKKTSKKSTVRPRTFEKMYNDLADKLSDLVFKAVSSNTQSTLGVVADAQKRATESMKKAEESLKLAYETRQEEMLSREAFRAELKSDVRNEIKVTVNGKIDKLQATQEETQKTLKEFKEFMERVEPQIIKVEPIVKDREIKSNFWSVFDGGVESSIRWLKYIIVLGGAMSIVASAFVAVYKYIIIPLVIHH